MNGIFISYRRDDSAGYAGRLYDRLVTAFGAECVFMDVEGIELGTDFIAAIERALDSSSVFIALIGSEWTQTRDATGRRRLDDPQDFIRLETVMAVERRLRIVPVLVDDAPMPRADELPPEMASLARRQAIEINHRQWEASTGALIQALKPILESSAGGKVSIFGIGRGARRTLLAALGLLVVVAIGGVAYMNVGRGSAQSPEPVTPADVVPAVPKSVPAEIKAPPVMASIEPKPSAVVVPGHEAAVAPGLEAASDAQVTKKAPATPRAKAADTAVVPAAPTRTNASGTTHAATAAAPNKGGAAAVASRAAASERISSGPLAVGDRWTYRVKSKWGNVREKTLQFAVAAVDGDTVTLALSEPGAESPQAPTRQRVAGSQPAIFEWLGFGKEFAPFMGAFGGLGTDARWSGMSVSAPSGFVGRFSCHGKAAGSEQVRVPAGAFAATIVSIDCNRQTSGSVAEKSAEVVWIHFDIWYAASVKRYVKLMRREVTVDRTEADKDTVELLDYRLAKP